MMENTSGRPSHAFKVLGGIVLAVLSVWLLVKTVHDIMVLPLVGAPEPQEHVITIQGEGRALIQPDTARAYLQVENRGAEIGSVQDKTTNTVNELIAKVKKIGMK